MQNSTKLYTIAHNSTTLIALLQNFSRMNKLLQLHTTLNIFRTLYTILQKTQNITKLYKQINKSFTTLLQNFFKKNYTKLFFSQNNFTKLSKTLLIAKNIQNCTKLIKLYNTLHNFYKNSTQLYKTFTTTARQNITNTPQTWTNKCKLFNTTL